MRLSCKLLMAAGLLAGLCGAGAGQSPLPRGALGGYDLLLQTGVVQKELKLTDEQRQKLREVVREARQRHRGELEKTQALGEEERRAKREEVFRAISEETRKAAGE